MSVQEYSLHKKKKSQLKGRDPFYVGFFWTEGVVGMDEGFMTVNIEKLYGTAWCLESEARGEKKERKKEKEEGTLIYGSRILTHSVVLTKPRK